MYFLCFAAAPCWAFRVKTDSNFGLEQEGGFSLARNIEINPHRIEHLMTDMRSVLTENFKGLSERSHVPDSSEQKLRGQIDSMLKETKNFHFEDTLATSEIWAKLPPEQAQVLLQMGQEIKSFFRSSPLNDIIAERILKAKQFQEEHKEIFEDVARIAKHIPSESDSRVRPIPEGLLKEMPGLAKKILPVLTPVRIPSSLLQEAARQNVSAGTAATDSSLTNSTPPDFHTRFECGLTMTLKVGCVKEDVCFKMPMSVNMVRLLTIGRVGKSPGFLVVSFGLNMVMAKFGFAVKGPFIPMPVPHDKQGDDKQDDKRILGLVALKTGFAMSFGFNTHNMSKEVERDWKPVITATFGTSILPIATTMAPLRAEPMVEVAVSNDFFEDRLDAETTKRSLNQTETKSTLKVTVGAKLRTAYIYNKHQFFAITKASLGALSPGENWLYKPPKLPSALTVGLLVHLCPGKLQICEDYDNRTSVTSGQTYFKVQ